MNETKCAVEELANSLTSQQWYCLLKLLEIDNQRYPASMAQKDELLKDIRKSWLLHVGADSESLPVVVTRKDNHDSMWLKLKAGSNYARLFIGRNGYKVESTNTPKFVGIAREMGRLYGTLIDEGKKKYGDALDIVEKEMRRKYC